MVVKRLLLLAGVFSVTQAFSQTDTTKTRKDSLFNELKENLLDNIPTVTLDDNDFGDGGGQNISSALSAGRDPYFNAATFNWSASRFRIRGYNNEEFSTYMNGIPMDNLDNGFTPYGLWGGLNDVMRNRDVSFGLKPTTFAFGDIGSATNIDVRASKQRAQTSVSYAASNRNYNNRIMFTHSTGLSKRGWAFSLSGSRRWAGEGYVPGTYYDGWGWFAAIDKKINSRHLLSLTAFGAPTENGRQGGAVQEMMDIAGTNYYNPNWGWQNGKKRNASIGRTNQPVFLLNHEFRINNNTTLNTGVAYSFGERSVTALDWYNSADPRPDYYRYLPSYYKADPGLESQIREELVNNENLRQVNWDRLYDVNNANVRTVRNPDGTQVTGKRSLYIQERRITNTNRFNFNSTINTRLSNNVEFTGGIQFQKQDNHYYKRVEDLLGGDFYLNLNQFAERQFPSDNVANRWDLNDQKIVLGVGDKYGYDYNINLTKGAAFAQGVYKLNKVDIFVAGQLSHTQFYREGNNLVGLFQNNSYGKSKTMRFTNFMIKSGLTYKLNGRNYLYANAAVGNRAPFFENVFLATRTRNSIQPEVQSENIQTVEGGFLHNSPNLRIRLGGFFTQFQNGMDVMTFYHDGYQNFVNYALSGINKQHYGAEIGVEYKLTQTLTVNASAHLSRYLYTSRQKALITSDNVDTIIGRATIYSDGFRVPSTPQEAYSVGLSYRSPKYWFVNLTASYFDNSWLSFNPVRRTTDAVDAIDKNSELYKSIVNQQKFDGQYTVDFFGGYSWLMPRKLSVANKRTYLVFNVGVNNLLNNKKIISGGFEQLRFDELGKDVNKFPPRYFYAYGANFFASVTFRF
ncbi:TonB-dependent receptor [Polluticaenibacter yanchengensis]|uniref:TonB-dependent receptor n=1 Tax=Polluticaenibacter yanchengensis TaxID=3014562 RepID=A0ABT4UIY9_9BACT|nr:TonB-dependent receptor [Chitinophagaceae bacterium LY-5]